MSSQPYSFQHPQLVGGRSKTPFSAMKPLRTEHKRPLEILLDLVADEEYFNLTQAAEFARTAFLNDPSFDDSIVEAAEKGGLLAEQVIRLIRILEVICPKPNLLNHLLQLHVPDQRVRSKVTLTIGRLVQNATWLKEQLNDSNPRVRANVIEALWDSRVEGADEYLKDAINDSSNNRAVANAACGLHKLGVLEAVQVIKDLLLHPEPEFRRSGIWAVTHLGDTRFIPVLSDTQNLADMDEEEESLRAAAIQYLEGRLDIARFSDVVQLKLKSMAVSARARRSIHLACVPSFPGTLFAPSDVSAMNIQIEEDGQPVDDFSIRWTKQTEGLRAIILAPDGVALRTEFAKNKNSDEIDDVLSIVRFQATPVTSSDAESAVGRFGSAGVSRMLPTLTRAISNALSTAKMHSGDCHIFVVLNASQTELPPAALQKSIRTSGVALHALVAKECNEELAQAFTKLSAETNGLSLVASSAHSLAEQLHQVRAEHFSTLQLNWKGNLEKPKSIICRFVGPKGFAEVHIPVSHTSSTNVSKRRAK